MHYTGASCPVVVQSGSVPARGGGGRHKRQKKGAKVWGQMGRTGGRMTRGPAAGALPSAPAGFVEQHRLWVGGSEPKQCWLSRVVTRESTGGVWLVSEEENGRPGRCFLQGPRLQAATVGGRHLKNWL